MITGIALVCLRVLDLDEAKDFYTELKARGVEFTEEPHERFYGVDAAFRDPSGNYWRLTQTKPARPPID